MLAMTVGLSAWRPSVTSESVRSGGPIRIEEVGK